MNFPKRITQHKNESDSFAIILYHLKGLGIFRNVTESDYGIDFEIELVEDDFVKGHAVKVQVKARETKNLWKKNGEVKICGIKQTSLNYWAELSYSMPVIAMAVDLGKEDIYVSEPLFWQSIQLLDATDDKKAIVIGKKKTDTEVIETIRRTALSCCLRDELYAHKWVLRNLSGILSMYDETLYCDVWCCNYEPHFFHEFLENSYSILPLKDKEYETLFKLDDYLKRSRCDELNNQVAKDGLDILLPAILIILNKYRDRVLNSAYYWAEKDPEYLRLVYECRIPTEDEFQRITNKEICYRDIEFKNNNFFSFISEKTKEYKIEDGRLFSKFRIL